MFCRFCDIDLYFDAKLYKKPCRINRKCVNLQSNSKSLMKEKQNIEFMRLHFPTFEQVRGGMLTTIPRERFVAINNGTLQKSDQETETTQKTTQKTDSGTETTQKTTEKILRLIKENPSITNKELARLCDITEDGVFYHIKKMKAAGVIRRIGPDKGGHWEVIEKP